MKRTPLKLLVAVTLIFGVALSLISVGTYSEVFAEENQSFLTETEIAGDYSSLSAAPAYQGENGFYLKQGNYNGSNLFRDENGIWSGDGEGNGSVVNDGIRFFPGKNGVSLEWKAPVSSRVSFRGIIYNTYAYDATDMSAYGVNDRVSTDKNRNDITISVSFYSAANQLTELYRKEFNSDFVLFADRTIYSASENDRFIVTVESTGEDSSEEVCIYLDVTSDSCVAKYDFRKESSYKDGNVEDLSGNGNYMKFGPNFTSKEVDENKGLYFAGFNTENGHNLSNTFLYNPMYVTRDFTDDLTDFSFKLSFTLDNKPAVYAERWQYLISTTSDAKNQKGFAIRTEDMGDTADGRTKYALKICIFDSLEVENQSFYFTSNGWLVTLLAGTPYELILNVSSSEKKAEMFLYGAWFVDDASTWTGRNRTETVSLSTSWSMENSGNGTDTFGNGLTIGAEDEAGKEGFKGWISELSVYNYVQTVTECTRPGTFGTVSVTSVKETVNADYDASESAIIEKLNTESGTIELNTDNGSVTNGAVNWKEVIYDGVEYYALGTVSVNGVKNTGVTTVRANVGAYVAKMKYNGEVIGYLTASNDGNSTFVRPESIPAISGDDVIRFYSDEELTTEYGFDEKATTDCVIYIGTTPREYTITYVLDGGVNNGQNPSVYNKDSGTIQFAEPTKEGYRFEGWYIDNETKVTFIDSSKKEDIVLYARWSKTENNANGGQGGEETGKGGCGGSSQSTLLGCVLAIFVCLGSFVYKKR